MPARIQTGSGRSKIHGNATHAETHRHMHRLARHFRRWLRSQDQRADQGQPEQQARQHRGHRQPFAQRHGTHLLDHEAAVEKRAVLREQARRLVIA